MTLGTKWTGLLVEVVVDSRASTLSPPGKEGKGGQVEEAVVEVISVEI